MAGTTAIDALVVIFQSLAKQEQDEALVRLNDARLVAVGEAETEIERHLRSLRRVADVLGHTPGIAEYKTVSAELQAAGEHIEAFSRLYRYFEHSWERVREALDLTKTSTASRIEWRFRNRRMGKVWRYGEETMRDALLQAAEHWGHPPTVAEFEWWRTRQIEIAKASGADTPHLPSTGPYRKRWGTWEGALLHFGFTPEQVAERLESGQRRAPVHLPDAFLPDGLPIAELPGRRPDGCGFDNDRYGLLRQAWQELPRRSRYILTARLGLGTEKLTLKDTAAPLALTFTWICELQTAALQSLAEAVGFKKGKDMAAVVVAVQEALKVAAVLPDYHSSSDGAEAPSLTG